MFKSIFRLEYRVRDYVFTNTLQRQKNRKKNLYLKIWGFKGDIVWTMIMMASCFVHKQHADDEFGVWTLQGLNIHPPQDPSTLISKSLFVHKE